MTVPAGTRSLNLAGKTIVPGFIDAHAHGPQGQDGFVPQQNWSAQANLALGTTTVLLLVGTACWGLHLGLTQSLFATLVADTAPPQLRGSAFGVLNLVTGVALLAASVMAGRSPYDAGPATSGTGESP